MNRRMILRQAKLNVYMLNQSSVFFKVSVLWKDSLYTLKEAMQPLLLGQGLFLHRRYPML
jgi:hypothetical protein